MSETQSRSGLPTLEEAKEIQRARAEHIRESWVRTMELRLVKEELNKCYRGEGVNSKQFCKDLAERYISMLRENQLGGFVQLDQQ